MSSATTIAIVAATVVAAASASYAGYAANDAAQEEADLKREQAEQERQAAATEAEKIRERGRRVAATQEAALAGSGVKLDGQGTGNELLAETGRLTEQDALAAITTGRNRASLLKGEAEIAKVRGQAALISGGLNTASSLIGGVASYQKSTQETRAADIVDRKTRYTIVGGS